VPAYSLAERDRRWAIGRAVMDDADVDALIVYGEHELAGPMPFAPDAWFTNDRPGTIVLVTREEEPFSLVWGPGHVLDHIEATRRGDATWIRPEHMRVAKHARGLADLLRERGLSRSALGVIGLEPYPPFHFNPIMPHELWESVLRQLPHATFKPVWVNFLLRTLAQSPEEVAVIEYAAAAGQAMAAAMVAAAGPGATETELYAAAMAAGHRRGIAVPNILLASGQEFVAWGPPAWAYRPQPPRTLADGDLVLAEISCSHGMREAQVQVAIAVGDVHPDVERAASVAHASYQAGLAVLRPGRTFAEVCAAMREPVEAAGGWIVHPLIHGMNPYGAVSAFGSGLRALPETAAYGLVADVATTGHDLRLEPGMTFSLEPNCAFGRRQARLGGTVVVGTHGPAELSRVPRLHQV